MIKEILKKIINNYGHIKVISQILKSVEKTFL